MIESLYLVFHTWLMASLVSGTLTYLAAKEVAKREK